MGPPPDLKAQAQPGALPQVNQGSGPHGGDLAMSPGTPQESVPYTMEGDPFLTPSRPIVGVSRASPAPRGGVSSFQDDGGVRQITNLAAPPEPEARPRDAVGQDQAIALAPGPPPAIQPVSWPPAEASPPTAREAAVKAARESVIYSFRDHQGVLHIDNTRLVENTAPAANLATRKNGAPVPGLILAGLVRAPPANAPPRAPGKSEAEPVAGQSPVRSHRDRHGVIHISNSRPEDSCPAAAEALAALAKLQPLIAEATQLYRLPPALVTAVIQAESNFVPWAVSAKGAMGLMQLMPDTATGLGVRDPFNPRENIMAGCRHLRYLLDRFQGSPALAVAAYNAGHQRVVAAGYTIPAIRETQEFVKNVMELYYLMEQGRMAQGRRGS